MGSIWSHPKETHESTGIFKTNYGKIRGRKFRISCNRYVNAFLGIPYAKPPIGCNRFKKPQPPDPWPHVRECVQHAMRAPQHDMIIEKFSKRIPTSEDCLYLNVFAPEWDCYNEQNNGRAVMIWIHGGAFVIHSSANYGDRGICRCLCSKGVIVVTIQYRLGILGFTATGDEHSIPNLGLWDQAMALKWVKENIAEFGGDPNNITVFGQSAGGVCADLLCLSPYTRDLFDKVIAMGGTANCSWALRDIRKIKEAAMSHAYSLGWQYPENASDEEISASLMRFLLQQPANSLALSLTGRDLFKSNVAGVIYGPVIDGDFIPESISDLRKKTPKKYCMGGTTDYETLLFAGFGRKKLDMRTFDEFLNEAIPQDKYPNYYHLQKLATSLYVQEKCNSDQIKRACIKLSSDIFVTNGVHDYVEDMLNEGHTTYLYNFEYFTPRGFGLLRWTLPFFAATHGSELAYLFGKSMFENFKPNSTDKVVIENFTTLFTNFAKYGNVNGGHIEDMEPLNEFDQWRYVRIDQDVTMKYNFQEKRANFWRCLQENKFHLLNVDKNSIQTQTELQFLSMGSQQNFKTSIKVCCCQETQTSMNCCKVEQMPSSDKLMQNNFVNTSTIRSSDVVFQSNEKDSNRSEDDYEEVCVSSEFIAQQVDSINRDEAQIVFIDFTDQTTLKRYKDDDHDGRDISNDVEKKTVENSSFRSMDISKDGICVDDIKAINNNNYSNHLLSYEEMIPQKLTNDSDELLKNQQNQKPICSQDIATQTDCKCSGPTTCDRSTETLDSRNNSDEILPDVHPTDEHNNNNINAISRSNAINCEDDIKCRRSNRCDIEWVDYEEALANI